MQDADFRRQWVQDRINDLLGKERLSYAEIARRMGISHRQQVHAVAKGGPVGKDFIDRLCRAFNFQPPIMPGAKPIIDVVNSPTTGDRYTPVLTIDAAQGNKQAPPPADQLERLTRAVEEQGVLLRTLTELIIARLGKEALKG